MALNRYVLTANVTVPGAAASAVVAGEPGTGGAAGFGNTSVAAAGYTYFPQTFLSGTAIVLDPAGPLFAAIGAGNLRAFAQGIDDVGHAALSN